jgi:tRNA nucleotidyltransferase/poly(A) polymerase
MANPPNPLYQRQFAVEVVQRLRGAGFEAYWAGGCVRDQLLGRTPKDYDVATSALPPQIRELFGRKRTLPIGAAFGVITVLGPPEAGQIEVATFRRDADYSDGRHPNSVTFSTPEHDAQRRDFTINGLFFDPLEDRVIDFVGGRQDLRDGVLRAIGDPFERFREDKLRMLRAVRFAATFEFRLDAATADAIRRMAATIHVVSPERIGGEMQRILVDWHRAPGIRLLLDVGLAAEVLPEIAGPTPEDAERLAGALALLAQLEKPGLPLALAALLVPWVDAEFAAAVCQRWRLSNDQAHRTAWLIEHRGALRGGAAKPWSALQRLFIDPGMADLVALEEAAVRAGQADPSDAAWARAALGRPREELDPPPLLTGNDLIASGVPRGPRYRVILDRVRNAQLDGQLHTRDDALRFVNRIRRGVGE